MISAIIEILLLLTVSCLIGIFFTYRFWKSKWTTLELERKNLASELDQAGEELKSRNNKIDELKKENRNLSSQLKGKKNVEKPSKKQDDKEVKELKNELELVHEQLDEKERELQVVSEELEKRKVSYYKHIEGKRYKAVTLNMADDAIEGQGDGRISKEDAEKIFATISDGKLYTQVEKDTMRYLRDHYKWTDGADKLFRTKVRSWAAKGHKLDEAIN